MKTIIIISCLLASLSWADPQPTGGATCTRDIDCGGVGAGYCEPIQLTQSRFVEQNTAGFCACPQDRGNPDCSYQRKSRELTGGLQFLCFVGVGGVGNLILERNLFGGLQLAFMLSTYLIAVAGCISLCAGSIKEKMGVGLFGGLTCLFATLSFIGWLWSIIDGALILQGKVVDGNGYSTF